MEIHEVTDTIDLLDTVKALPAASDTEEHDGLISFGFVDKDGDRISVVVSTVDRERLVLCAVMKWPEDFVLAALTAANAWNGRRDAHGTFSYWEPNYLALESHLLLRGGVTLSNVKEWLRNFVSAINAWEMVVIPVANEVGSDSAFEETPAGSSRNWSSLGRVVAGFIDGLSQ